jgi:hypothetical protein
MTPRSRQPDRRNEAAAAVRNVEDIARLEHESQAAISAGERVGIASPTPPARSSARFST